MHPITLDVRLHGAVIKLLYRVLSWNHPRGWVDMHAVFEGERRETLWIHTHGMGRFGRADLELVGVPNDLRGFAHAILFDVLGYTRSVKPIAPDEHFGGNLVGGPSQAVPHLATARAVPDRDASHRGVLRLVDHGAPADAGFPFRLFAAHLCALADTTRSLGRSEALFRRSTEIFPGEYVEPTAGVDPRTGEVDLLALQARANVRGWEGLGTTLASLGRVAEAVEAFEQAIARAPAWGRHFAKFVADHAGRELPSGDDPIVRFWTDVDVDEVRARRAAR